MFHEATTSTTRSLLERDQNETNTDLCLSLQSGSSGCSLLSGRIIAIVNGISVQIHTLRTSGHSKHKRPWASLRKSCALIKMPRGWKQKMLASSLLSSLTDPPPLLKIYCSLDGREASMLLGGLKILRRTGIRLELSGRIAIGSNGIRLLNLRRMPIGGRCEWAFIKTPITFFSATNAAFKAGYVIGGQEADFSQWAFTVSLQSFGSHFCGAVIYDETHIVTAAHCVVGSNP